MFRNASAALSWTSSRASSDTRIAASRSSSRVPAKPRLAASVGLPHPRVSAACASPAGRRETPTAASGRSLGRSRRRRGGGKATRSGAGGKKRPRRSARNEDEEPSSERRADDDEDPPRKKSDDAEGSKNPPPCSKARTLDRSSRPNGRRHASAHRSADSASRKYAEAPREDAGSEDAGSVGIGVVEGSFDDRVFSVGSAASSRSRSGSGPSSPPPRGALGVPFSKRRGSLGGRRRPIASRTRRARGARDVRAAVASSPRAVGSRRFAYAGDGGHPGRGSPVRRSVT